MNMDEKFIKKQKNFLLEEKERIETQVKNLKKYPDYGYDSEDNLQELSDYESNLSLEDKLQFILKKIENALKAIDNGTYGKCSKCKENIENGRLEIMPYADVCVSCSGKKRT